MILEAKALMTVLSILFLGIVLKQLIYTNLLSVMLIIMAIGFIVFGDIVNGYFITKSRANKIIDKPPPGYVTAVILTLNRMIDFEYAKTGPHGKREFIYNGKEASIIDQGEYPIHFPNGAIGFICHEKSSGSLDMKKIKYAENLNKKLGTNNIKEIYSIAKEVDKEEQ